MRHLIVQGLVWSNFTDAELQSFWIPCMRTVKAWATRNGYDYQFFHQPKTIAPHDPLAFDISTWDQMLMLGREVLTQNQFYKLQWMNDWSGYDYVWWLDADCYIWGNPLIFGIQEYSSSMTSVSCNFGWHSTIQGRWKRPNMSVWGGLQKEVQRAIDWARTQFQNPTEQGEILQTIRILNRYPIITGDSSLRQQFTEEIFMAAYTHPREGRGVQVREPSSHVQGQYPDTWKPDAIVHLGGANKIKQLTQLRAYIAYMEYISKPDIDWKKESSNELD